MLWSCDARNSYCVRWPQNGARKPFVNECLSAHKNEGYYETFLFLLVPRIFCDRIFNSYISFICDAILDRLDILKCRKILKSIILNTFISNCMINVTTLFRPTSFAAVFVLRSSKSLEFAICTLYSSRAVCYNFITHCKIFYVERVSI